MGSLTTAPAMTVDGPLFVNVIVYVVEVPATTDATPSDFVSARSAAGSTIVLCEPASFAGFGSNVVDVTVAVSV